MSNLVKEIIIAAGGGTVVLIGFLFFLKYVVQKIANSAIDTAFDKNIIKFSNKIERTTKAYEILMKKEFDFYEKVDSPLASLIPSIVDMHDFVVQPNKFENLDVKEKYKEAFLNYLENMICIKEDVLIYQAYIPETVFNMAMNLIGLLQTYIDFFSETLHIIWKKKEGDVDINQMNQINDTLLISIAKLEVTIKTRLQELSGSSNNGC